MGNNVYVTLIPQDTKSVAFGGQVNGDLLINRANLENGQVLYLTNTFETQTVDQSQPVAAVQHDDLGGVAWTSVGSWNVDSADKANLTVKVSGSGNGPVSMSSVRLQRRDVPKLDVLNLAGNPLDERAHSSIIAYAQASQTSEHQIIDQPGTKLVEGIVADQASTSVSLPGLEPIAIDTSLTNITGYRDSIMKTSGLIGYWPLNSVSGNSVADLATQRNGIVNGTLTSSSTSAINGDMSSVEFSGGLTGGTISLSSLPVATGTTAQNTVSFWMNWDGTEGVMPFSFTDYALFLNAGGFGFNVDQTNPSSPNLNNLFGVSSSGLQNRWVHVVAIFSNAGVANSELYLDGVKQSLGFRSGNGGLPKASTSTAIVGGFNSTIGLHPAYRFKGRLDELAIFSRALTQPEVQAQLNAARGPTFTSKTQFSIDTTQPIRVVAVPQDQSSDLNVTVNEIRPNVYELTTTATTNTKGVAQVDVRVDQLSSNLDRYRDTVIGVNGNIGYWPLDRFTAGGTQIQDLTGNKNGTLVSPSQLAVSSARAFNGAESAIDFYGGSATISGLSNMNLATSQFNTVSFWMRYDELARACHFPSYSRLICGTTF